jgi:hypothetical protein
VSFLFLGAPRAAPAFDVAWSENVKAVVAGVSAVAMVQTIIIGYILSAFRE